MNNLVILRNAVKNDDKTGFLLKKIEEIAFAEKLSEINFDDGCMHGV